MNKIDIQSLQNFLGNHRVIFAQTDTKILQVCLNGNLEVLTKDIEADELEIVWRGVQPYPALEYYNRLP